METTIELAKVLGYFTIFLAIGNAIGNRLVYGKMLDDNHSYTLISYNLVKGTRLNSFSSDQIKIGDMWIGHILIPSLFCKYYIEGLGRIFRWGKTHKLIIKCFKEVPHEY